MADIVERLESLASGLTKPAGIVQKPVLVQGILDAITEIKRLRAASLNGRNRRLTSWDKS